MIIPLTTPAVTIGPAADAAVGVTSDVASNNHFTLTHSSVGVLFQDHSCYGTTVNGTWIHHQQQLVVLPLLLTIGDHPSTVRITVDTSQTQFAEHYRVLRLLGEGRTSNVSLCQTLDGDGSRLVAVKEADLFRQWRPKLRIIERFYF